MWTLGVFNLHKWLIYFHWAAFLWASDFPVYEMRLIVCILQDEYENSNEVTNLKYLLNCKVEEYMT